MSDDRYEPIVERLAAIEEELRDLAYDRLRDRAAIPTARRARPRTPTRSGSSRPRRAIAKAIGALTPRHSFGD